MRPIRFPTWSLRLPARVARAFLQSALFFPVHRFVCRPFTVEGREHVQDLTHPVLFVANHTSHVDTPSILRALPFHIRRRTAVAAAADYFYRARTLALITSLLLNTFPFSRKGAVRPSLKYCAKLADEGWSILIYPEGTRSTSGEILSFRSGIGLLAKQLRLTVVPIAVEGGREILPKGRAWPRRGSVTVRIGEPIRLSPSDDRQAAAALLEEAVASLMDQ